MNNFTEDDIKRTGLPPDVMGLLHDLCYHVNNKLRGTMDDIAIENYVGRAQDILRRESPKCSLVLGDNTICDKIEGHKGEHGRNYIPQATCPECRATNQLTLGALNGRILLNCGKCMQWWSIGEIEHTPYFFGGEKASNGPNKLRPCAIEGCHYPVVFGDKCSEHSKEKVLP